MAHLQSTPPRLAAAQQIPLVVPCKANIGSYSKGKCVNCFLCETVLIFFSVEFSDTLSASLLVTAFLIPLPSNKYTSGCLTPLSVGTDLLSNAQEGVSSCQVSLTCLFPGNQRLDLVWTRDSSWASHSWPRNLELEGTVSWLVEDWNCKI